MTLSEWADEMGISRQTAYQMYKDGRMPPQYRAWSVRLEGRKRDMIVVEKIPTIETLLKRIDEKVDRLLDRAAPRE